jgi:hypothetical protein
MKEFLSKEACREITEKLSTLLKDRAKMAEAAVKMADRR